MKNAKDDSGAPASKLKTFLIRAASAIVAVLVVWILYSQFQANGFKILVWFAIILGGREAQKLVLEAQDGLPARVLLMGEPILLALIATFTPSLFLPSFLVLLMFNYVALQWLNRWDASPDEMRSLFLRLMVGVLYIGVVPGVCLLLLNMPHGAVWFYTMLVMVFAGDTLAYLVGMKFGRTKLIPNISPKKTVEGALGGILGTLIAAVCLKSQLPEMTWGLWIPFSFVAAVFAQSGDFFESMLKRAVSLKDSGGIMPGHGGVLDRIDGVLFAIPLFHLLAFSLVP